MLIGRDGRARHRSLPRFEESKRTPLETPLEKTSAARDLGVQECVERGNRSNSGIIAIFSRPEMTSSVISSFHRWCTG